MSNPTTTTRPSWAEALRRCDAALATASELLTNGSNSYTISPLLDDIDVLRVQLSTCASEDWQRALLAHLTACGGAIQGLALLRGLDATCILSHIPSAFHADILNGVQDRVKLQIHIARQAIAAWSAGEK